jgi:hypothetical protein
LIAASVPPLGRLRNGHLDACFLDPEAKRGRRDATIHPELQTESA